jgi:hypothetical protein
MNGNTLNWTTSKICDRSLIATLLCTLLGTLVLAGCGSGPYESAPVNPEIARETLNAALDSWKNGETVESLKEDSPSIVVQDFDWSGGAKLLEYEVLDDGKPESANLVAKVKLSLEGKDGTKSEKTVTYVVGTAPVLTVFRDMFK